MVAKTLNIVGVQKFVESLSLPCDDLTNALFKTTDDCNTFYINFYGKNRFVADDLMDFREYLISISNITLERFVDMCKDGNLRQAFTDTFFQTFTNSDMELVYKSIARGSVTIENLFTSFKKNINKNIMRNVL